MTIENDAFRRFVNSEVTPDLWHSFEGEDASVWGAVRVPLVTAVVVLCAVVASSRPKFAAVGALIPSIAATMPEVIKFLTSIAP